MTSDVCISTNGGVGLKRILLHKKVKRNSINLYVRNRLTIGLLRKIELASTAPRLRVFSRKDKGYDSNLLDLINPNKKYSAPEWVDVAPEVKAAYMTHVMSYPRAFTLNLSTALIKRAEEAPNPLDYIRRRVAGQLERFNDAPVGFWFSLELDANSCDRTGKRLPSWWQQLGRPHLHGVIDAPDNRLESIRLGLHAANFNKYAPGFKQYAIVFKPIHAPLGWAEYACKERTMVSLFFLNGDPMCADNTTRRNARRLYTDFKLRSADQIQMLISS